MNLFFLTFRKDLRRLWPVALVTLVMLAELSRRDRWRTDPMVSSTEGWLAILLTFAWCCLAALAVLEEPLVGDRNFWTTRPHRWPPLLAAKLAFVIAVIHIPALLADVYIVSARGFSPVHDAANLLAKQALLFALVTLPSMAIAALVRSFTHFVVAAFTMAAIILIVSGGFDALSPMLPNYVRQSIVKVLVTVAATAVLAIMYAGRRVLSGRIVAGAALISGVAVAAWLPARAEFLHYGPESLRLTLRDAPLDPSLSGGYGDRRHTVILAVSLEGSMPAGRYRAALLDVVIETADGSGLHSIQPRPNLRIEKINLIARLIPGAAGAAHSASFLVLTFSDAAWNLVKNGPVYLRGQAAFHFFYYGPVTTIALGRSAAVPNVGLCTFARADDDLSTDMAKVFCESTGEIPPTQINHRIPGRDLAMSTVMGSFTGTPGPQRNWLSPIYRAQTYRQLSPRVRRGDPFYIGPEEASRTVTDISPLLSAGDARATIDFPNVRLANWLAPQR